MMRPKEPLDVPIYTGSVGECHPLDPLPATCITNLLIEILKQPLQLSRRMGGCSIGAAYFPLGARGNCCQRDALLSGPYS